MDLAKDSGQWFFPLARTAVVKPSCRVIDVEEHLKHCEEDKKDMPIHGIEPWILSYHLQEGLRVTRRTTYVGVSVNVLYSYRFGIH